VHPEKTRLRDERRERERCKVDVLLAVFGEQCGERGFFYEGVSVHIIKGERFDLPVVNSIVVPRWTQQQFAIVDVKGERGRERERERGVERKSVLKALEILKKCSEKQ